MSKLINSTTSAIFNDHAKAVMVVGDKYGFVDDYASALKKWEDYATKYSSPSNVYPLQPNESIFGFGYKDGMYKLSQVTPVDDIDAIFDQLIAKAEAHRANIDKSKND